MPSSDSQDTSLRCPHCGTDNFNFASFCIVCGEPVDGISDGPAPVGELQDWTQQVGASEAEQLPSARSRTRWEALAGLILLALIIGYAMLQWQRDTSQSNAYRQGLVAAQTRDWDKAAANFGQAGDHPDAQRMADEAHRQIDQRNRLYTRAIEASRRHDWENAISLFRQVQTIQPTYRDSKAQLTQVRDEVFKRGLANIAYLTDAGLYVRDAEGGTYLLPGSDRYSAIRAVSPDGLSLVYDRPAKPEDFVGFPRGQTSVLRSAPSSKGRIPVLASMSKATGAVITLYPLLALDSYGTGVFSKNGLWWYGPQSGKEAYNNEVYYYNPHLAATVGAVRISDVGNNKRVVAVDPPRERVILAESTGGTQGPKRQTSLYLAGAMGQNPQLLDVANGDIYQASVSRDGKWLLYVTERNTADIVKTAWILPLDSASLENLPAPRALGALSWSGSEMISRLSAAFIPTSSGPFRVAVNSEEPYSGGLTIYDLADNANLWIGPPDDPFPPGRAGFSHNGRYLIARSQQGRNALLEMVDLDPGGWIFQYKVFPALGNQVVHAQFSPRDDFVLAAVEGPDGVVQGTTQDIYSAPVTGDGRLGQSRKIASAQLPYDPTKPAVALPPSGILLAYVNAAQELHAIFYDGNSDTVVASNVRAVWDLTDSSDLVWWR